MSGSIFRRLGKVEKSKEGVDVSPPFFGKKKNEIRGNHLIFGFEWNPGYAAEWLAQNWGFWVFGFLVFLPLISRDFLLQDEMR